MKNIALIINDLKGNGAERVVITLSESFIALGHSATIICFNDFIELPVNKKINVLSFNINRWRWIPRSLRGRVVSYFLDRFILRKIGAPDLILSNLLPVDRIMCESKLSNVNLVVHNTMSSEYKFNLDLIENFKHSEVFKIYSKKPVICVSQGVADDFKSLFPLHEGCNQIYNPINADLIKTYANECDVPYKNYIVHVGKFKREKRHDVLIKAYAKAEIDKLLVLVGQGALESEYKALVSQLNLTGKVIFAGFHSNPYPLIKNADLLVLSSDFEGLPTVLLESLSLSTPAISSDCPSGPREILPSNNLFPQDNIDKLAEFLSVPDYSIYKTELPDKFYADTIAKKHLTKA
ncbi:glycosyltransferase [Pseudomonadales bacterium]|nr:glycosyltransferase [Pseudomonadales bacterium]